MTYRAEYTIDLPDGAAGRKMFLAWLKRLHDVIQESPNIQGMDEYTADQIYLKDIALNIDRRFKITYSSLGIDDLIVELEE